MLMPTEEERIHMFFIWLSFPIRLVIEQIVVLVVFLYIVDHEHTAKGTHHESYRDKWPHC